MKKEELHIGATYRSVKFNTPVTLTLSDFTQLEIMADGAELTEDIIAQMFAPLELNEEWLRRTGLDGTIEFMDSVYPNSFLRLEFNERDCCYYVTVGSDEYRIAKLKFVHEAQNFFALTGHKLEIK